MKFICDFHIHSRFSRATAKKLNLETLHIGAQIKGITVLGTGDFTHPGWFEEINELLVPAEEGLFKLMPDVAESIEYKIPRICRSEMRFMLVTEISNIYKKNGKTRKVHNLVFVPDLESASRFSMKLASIGNIGSDGRPILGLDSRNLLEILLETTDRGFFVPAHIWTPWFSLLGSKSGFDTIEECFEDLSPYIYALETGLSSDPAMNWRVSSLDGRTLISNSDAHSPANLGREANLFDTELSYDSIIQAMQKGDSSKFLGTLEFYPEEGKYHFDGHRKCDIRLHPEETHKKNDICPICGKGLTLGVLYRVNALSDRKEGERPKKTHPFSNILPLTDILSEILKVGAKSKKVSRCYNKIISNLGPELDVLQEKPLDKIESLGIPLLAEAIERMREKRILVKPGFDGEFGKIKIFSDSERQALTAQKKLFDLKTTCSEQNQNNESINPSQKKQYTVSENVTTIWPEADTPSQQQVNDAGNQAICHSLNVQQKEAVCANDSALLIVAGPGTGKTRTLTCKIAHLIHDSNVSAENILAVTFTNKAAAEMKSRLKELLGKAETFPFVGTFHSICFEILKTVLGKESFRIIDDEERKLFLKESLKAVKLQISGIRGKIKIIENEIVRAKQNLQAPCKVTNIDGGIDKDTFQKVYTAYQNLLKQQRAFDYEELIFEVINLFRNDDSLLDYYRELFRYILVDEYQDLNYGQYRLIRMLMPKDMEGENRGRGICAIGDPNQSIYGFRGSDVRFFTQFLSDFSDSRLIHLNQNYRSTEMILKASGQVIRNYRIGNSPPDIFSGIESIDKIEIIKSGNEKMEADKIVSEIEKLVGGTGFFSMDSGISDGSADHKDCSFEDIAVLFRLRNQGEILSEAFQKCGIPYQLVTKNAVFGAKGVAEIISMIKMLESHETALDKVLEQSVFQGTIQKQTLDEFLLEFKKVNGKKFSEISVEDKLKILMDHCMSSKVLSQDSFNDAAWNKVLDFSKKFGNNTFEFFAWTALHTDPDVLSFKSEKVLLSTMHAAKGLEFDVVFVSGCEQGLIPFLRNGEMMENPDEERRLFYVAMTRARKKLYLTWAAKRKIFGKDLNRELSPFVLDIEEKLRVNKNYVREPSRKGSQTQLQLF